MPGMMAVAPTMTTLITPTVIINSARVKPFSLDRM
jgi:hypothetical protein